MKQTILPILLSIACLTHASIVGQHIVWQKSIGGSGHDFIEDAIHTRDKGMLITCSSGSVVSGDKTEIGYGGYDYWIIKTDLNGEIL
jgi:hypothetical protein